MMIVLCEFNDDYFGTFNDDCFLVQSMTIVLSAFNGDCFGCIQ